jgi:hypothetical protein
MFKNKNLFPGSIIGSKDSTGGALKARLFLCSEFEQMFSTFSNKLFILVLEENRLPDEELLCKIKVSKERYLYRENYF